MFELAKLDYAYDAVEPYIDAKTMEIHHSKHHQAYVDKLNTALAGQPNVPNDIYKLIQNLDKLPEDIRRTVRNNGGGHANHTLFWQWLKPGGSKVPAGELARAIDNSFGGFDDFKKQFNDASVSLFGSGWVWLIQDVENLSITQMPLQDNPLMEGKKPLLGLDLWEHAYYLKYQNRRPEYIEAWWNTVNWDAVAGLMSSDF